MFSFVVVNGDISSPDPEQGTLRYWSRSEGYGFSSWFFWQEIGGRTDGKTAEGGAPVAPGHPALSAAVRAEAAPTRWQGEKESLAGWWMSWLEKTLA